MWKTACSMWSYADDRPHPASSWWRPKRNEQRAVPVGTSQRSFSVNPLFFSSTARQPSAASWMLVGSSSKVSPCVAQPGEPRPRLAKLPDTKTAQSTGIPSSQTHFRNDYPVDERLVSRVPAPCGVPKAALGACAFPLAWRFFGVGSEALRVGLPGGFAVTLRPAAGSGCGYRSRAAR